MKDYCDICGLEMDTTVEPDESGSEVCESCARKLTLRYRLAAALRELLKKHGPRKKWGLT